MKTITLNSKKYPCLFSNGALMRFCENETPRISLSGFFEWLKSIQKPDIDWTELAQLARLTHWGIYTALLREGKTTDNCPTWEEILDQMTTPGFMAEVIEALAHSLPESVSAKKKAAQAVSL